MEQPEHRLGMTVLEVRDSVSGFLSLEKETIAKLMASEDFSVLDTQLRKSVLGDYLPSPSWLVAEVDDSGVMVTHQWVVSVYGDSLAHCISALMKYRNAVATELGATVVGKIGSPIARNTGPLREQVVRREKCKRIRSRISKVGWLLAAGIVGMVLTTLGNAIVSGVLQ